MGLSLVGLGGGVVECFVNGVVVELKFGLF